MDLASTLREKDAEETNEDRNEDMNDDGDNNDGACRPIDDERFIDERVIGCMIAGAGRCADDERRADVDDDITSV